MIRAVAYYRKSNEDKGESIDQQRAWAAGACTRHGVEVIREFEDQSVSGWDTARRSGFLAMIEFCEQQERLGRPVGVVVCWHINRFSRADAVETSFFLHRLREAGVSGMLTQAKWIDFNKSEDRMLFTLEQEASAHRYSVDLSAACKRGKRAKAAKGLWTGGRVPYGYRAEGATFAIDPPAAEVVRLMFDTYAGGRVGLRSLGAMLVERGHRSPTGGPWSPPTLTGILRNPAYLGHLVTGRRTDNRFLATVKVPVSQATGKRARYTRHPQEQWVRSENAHPAIVTQQVFDRVQARFAANRGRTSPTKAFVLSGLVRCGGCGGPMTGRTFNNKANPHYYVCGRYSQYGRASGCHLNGVQEDRLVTAVADKLMEAHFNPTTLAALREEIRRQEQAPDAGGRRKFLTARIKELEGQVKTATLRMLTVGEEHFKDCEAALGELKREEAKHRQELEAIELAAVPAEDLDSLVETILGRMARFKELLIADPEGANVVLREMIDRVVLYFDHTDRKCRTLSKFCRGAVYLSEASCLSSSDSDGMKGRARRCR